MKQKNGFTLIEVLVALVILAIALTAVVKAVNSYIRHSEYLQEKTISYWVGMNIIASMQAGLLPSPHDDDIQRGQTKMLNQNWYWSAGIDPGSNKNIVRMYVTVSTTATTKPINHLIGFIFPSSL